MIFEKVLDGVFPDRTNDSFWKNVKLWMEHWWKSGAKFLQEIAGSGKLATRRDLYQVNDVLVDQIPIGKGSFQNFGVKRIFFPVGNKVHEEID